MREQTGVEREINPQQRCKRNQTGFISKTGCWSPMRGREGFRASGSWLGVGFLLLSRALLQVLS